MAGDLHRAYHPRGGRRFRRLASPVAPQISQVETSKDCGSLFMVSHPNSFRYCVVPFVAAGVGGKIAGKRLCRLVGCRGSFRQLCGALPFGKQVWIFLHWLVFLFRCVFHLMLVYEIGAYKLLLWVGMVVWEN